MRTSILACVVLLFFASAVRSGKRVERLVKCETPMILDGNWIYPENGGYKIVITEDDYITVNGYVYEIPPPPDTTAAPLPPSRERHFIDWLVRSEIEKARKMVDEGASPEYARAFIESTFAKCADEENRFRWEHEEHGGYRLFYDEHSCVVFPPEEPRKKRQTLKPYRIRILEPEFRRLILKLEYGFLVIKDVQGGSTSAFRNDDIAQIERELRDLPAKAKISKELTERFGHTRYQPIKIVDGRYRLTNSTIELLLHPRELKKK